MELMITVAVLAILSAIALFSYRQYSIRTSRSEAREALLEDAQFLERNYTTANRYDQDSQGNAIAVPVTQTPRDGGTTQYNIGFATGSLTAQAYTLQAAPTGSMAGDACGTYTLKQDGTQGVSGGTLTAQDCWGK